MGDSPRHENRSDDVARAQEVIRVLRAKIAIIADTVPKVAKRAAPANDDPQKRRVQYWEIIADNLSKAGWSWGCVAAVDSDGEQSGLLTHTAMTESASLFARMKSSLRFSNLKESRTNHFAS